MCETIKEGVEFHAQSSDFVNWNEKEGERSRSGTTSCSLPSCYWELVGECDRALGFWKWRVKTQEASQDPGPTVVCCGQNGVDQIVSREIFQNVDALTRKMMKGVLNGGILS